MKTDAMRQRDNDAAATRWITAYDAFDTPCVEPPTMAGIRWARRCVPGGEAWERCLYVSARGGAFDADNNTHVRVLYQRLAHEAVRQALEYAMGAPHCDDVTRSESEHNAWHARHALEQLHRVDIE